MRNVNERGAVAVEAAPLTPLVTLRRVREQVSLFMRDIDKKTPMTPRSIDPARPSLVDQAHAGDVSFWLYHGPVAT